MEHLKEIYEYRDMISSLVHRELRGKYEKSVLGFLWSFLSPMFQIVIYDIVFTRVFSNNMPNFYIFLMTGLLPWTFFSDALGNGCCAIIHNAEMVKKIYFPREVLVISNTTAKVVNMLLSFIVMAVFLIVSGVGFSIHIVLLPVVVLIQYVLALGCAFIVSSITVYLRDLEYVIYVILMAWIWATPIMYDLQNVNDPVFRKLIHYNPMTPIIVSYHDILYNHAWPNTADIVIPAIASIIILIFGYFLFGKLNRRFVEEL